MPINSTVNPWVLGNVVFGGVIGLAVDNATGAAWKPKVASIQRDARADVYGSAAAAAAAQLGSRIGPTCRTGDGDLLAASFSLQPANVVQNYLAKREDL